MSYRVNMIWDREAEVWVATSEDVPGLVLESGSFDALLERVKYAIPELKELNGQKPITNTHVTVDGKIKSRHTANEIMKQSGIDQRF